MKLKLIIDGYNLIKRVMSAQHVSQTRRDKFLKELGGYAKKRGHQILVVFDGGDTSFPYQEKMYGMEIVYSGYQETADDVIGRYVSENRGKEMFLVTSDRELADFARDCGVDILKSDEFYELLKSLGAEQATGMFDSALHKTTSSASNELDQLMIEGTKVVVIKEEVEDRSRESSSKKLSKAERIKQRKLKKL